MDAIRNAIGKKITFQACWAVLVPLPAAERMSLYRQVPDTDRQHLRS